MSSFSSVAHAFPHPRSAAVARIVNPSGHNAAAAASEEPVFLSPVWWRVRFLAFFSLLGEEMIGPIATPKRAAREASWLLEEVVAVEARTRRFAKLNSGSLSSSANLPAAVAAVAAADPLALFPNHLPMFDSQAEFLACWQHCLRKVFYHSILSESERQQQQALRMERARFDELPLPPAEALPSETQLEAVGRRIFWVERIGAYYVAANATVPRDADAIDSAVGQLLLEGNSYEDIWERVQRKYGVFVVVHSRDAAPATRDAASLMMPSGGSAGGGSSSSVSFVSSLPRLDGDDDEAERLERMSPLERAEYLLSHRERQRRKPAAVPTAVKPAAFSIAVVDAATQTFATTPAAALFTNLPAPIMTRAPSSSTQPAAGGDGSAAAAHEDDDDDIAEVERIAQRMLRDMEKAAAASGGGEESGATPPPPPPPPPVEDEDDDAVVAPPLVSTVTTRNPPASGAGAAAATKAPASASASTAGASALHDQREMRLAAMLLSSIPHDSANEEAFDGSRLTAHRRMDAARENGGAAAVADGGSVFAPPDLKRRLTAATAAALAHGRQTQMQMMSTAVQSTSNIDRMRRESVAAETQRRAARLREDDAILSQAKQASLGGGNGGTSSISSYSKFSYDNYIDPVSGNLPTHVIRALSTSKGKGEFERLRDLTLAAASAAAPSASSFGDVSQMVQDSHAEMMMMNSQQQPQPPVHVGAKTATPPTTTTADAAAGVFRCAVHVTGVVKPQLVSHLNMPTAALLSLIGDVEEAVSRCFEQLTSSQQQQLVRNSTTKLDLTVPIRALALKVTKCCEREECVEVVLGLCGRQRPQPYGMLRAAATKALSMIAEQKASAADPSTVLIQPLRLRAALGMPASSGIVSFAVHDMEAAVLPDMGGTATAPIQPPPSSLPSALTEANSNVLAQQQQLQQQWSADAIMKRLRQNSMTTDPDLATAAAARLGSSSNVWVGPALPPPKACDARPVL